MATTAPKTEQKETPDVTVLSRYVFERLAEYPFLICSFMAAKKVLNEDGTQKQNIFGKPLHKAVKGWEGWTIKIDSIHPACKTRMDAMLTNITTAIVVGGGSVDVDTAIENELIKLENDRRINALPEGAVVEGHAP